MRAYVTTLLCALALALGGLAAFNAYVDPLWFFAHANDTNRQQIGFDERQQKTNRLAFGGFPYDALLLGSSRTTYIDQHDFPGLKVFNYSVSGMRPAEYGGYIRYVRKVAGRTPPVIFIGIDFFATNRNYLGQAAPAEHYAGAAERPLYRLASLIGADTLKRSLANLKAREEDCDCYRRDNVKTMKFVSDEEKSLIFASGLKKFREEVYGPSYRYDDRLKDIWRDLRSENPDARFVVFTTPVSQPLFRTLLEAGRGPEYERWLGEAVEVFGEVYDFMGSNSVTRNLDNYQDAGHFSPGVGRLIALRLSGHDSEVPPDFGRRVTPENLKSHLAGIRRQGTAASRGVKS